MFDNANMLMDSGFPVAAERITGVNDNMSASHYHEFFELYYLESGERYHLIGDHLHFVTPGQFIIFEPYQLHHSYSDDNISFSRLLIYFNPSMIASSELKSCLDQISGVYQFDKIENMELYQLMNQILKEQTEKQLFFQDNMVNLTNRIMILLLRNKTKKQRTFENNLITQVISFINMNYMHKITIHQLAEHFYVSQWHLCREFKFYTHITINKYINNIRIIHAQKMLLENNKKITDISSEVGFDSITHFERVFKQITGITPSQYKKQNL